MRDVPGLTGHLLHQTLAVPEASLLQDGPPAAVCQFRHSKQSSLASTLKPVKFELDTLPGVEGCCQGPHRAHMSHGGGRQSDGGQERSDGGQRSARENVHLLSHVAVTSLLQRDILHKTKQTGQGTYNTTL